MKNALNQITNSLALLILVALLAAMFYGSAKITGAVIGQTETDFSPAKIIILSLILSCYLFFKLFFLIRENPKKDFNRLKQKTMELIKKEHHDEAFEHYNKMKEELEKFFKK